jgi:hypothetical protein
MMPCALHQHRPLPAGTPSASQKRRHQQPTLVQKYQAGLQPDGFFLMRGQSTLIQC